MEIVIEWGFQRGTERLPFDGSIAIYNGILGKVAPLAGDQATHMTGAAGWRSPAVGNLAARATAQILYVSYADTPVWPGQAKIEDVNRTIVTVRTKSGSFSFLPGDCKRGPILAPEYGFFVARASDASTAAAFRKELAAKGLGTLRQQIRARPEQTWQGAMRAVHTEVKGDFPPYPSPKVTAPMRVDVPEPHLNAAWKIGATNMLRNGRQGCPRQVAVPQPALRCPGPRNAPVSAGPGPHGAAPRGPRRLRDVAGADREPVPTPDGLWTGGPGRFFSGIEWDGCTGGGISLIHLDMLNHYRLTRDRQWLAANAAKLNANADWMIQQRKNFWEDIPAMNDCGPTACCRPTTSGITGCGDRGTRRTLRSAMRSHATRKSSRRLIAILRDGSPARPSCSARTCGPPWRSR